LAAKGRFYVKIFIVGDLGDWRVSAEGTDSPIGSSTGNLMLGFALFFQDFMVFTSYRQG
jgi:hypothetical protein